LGLIGDFRRLFVNRDDCYAVQLESGGYRRVQKPLTDDILEMHLKGEITIGSYQLDKENKVKYLCFDLDPEHLEDPKETAKRIIDVCLEKPDGKHPRVWRKAILLEASRYPDPSYHIWVFFEPELPAKAARWLGYRILELANLNPKQIEVFPKQDELTEEKPFGNFVKLPLGFHRVEQKWSRFLAPEDFKPVDADLSQVWGISFTEEDTKKILSFKRKSVVQIRLDLPSCFEALPAEEEEKVVRFLVKYWKPGYRNQLEISFLGLCIKRGVSYDSARRIIDQVTKRTCDEERSERLKLVDYHYQKRLDVPLKAVSGLREIIEEMTRNEVDN